MNYTSNMRKMVYSMAILFVLGSCMTGNQTFYESHEMVLVEPGSFYMGSDSGNGNEAEWEFAARGGDNGIRLVRTKL